MNAEGIDYFGRGHWLALVQARVSLKARRQMFELWKSYAAAFGPVLGRTLLDIGSTPDRERIDSNCMIPWFQESGLGVTLYSPEDIRGLVEVFPLVRILPAAGFGRPVPAPDRRYDWVTASAVIEHAGGASDQVEFIRECARVGHGLFLTTPNRAHWLEFHSKLPFIHWLPRRAHRGLLRRLGKELWANESHLRLLSRGELISMARKALGDDFDFKVISVWALGMPSNLILLARRKGAT